MLYCREHDVRLSVCNVGDCDHVVQQNVEIGTRLDSSVSRLYLHAEAHPDRNIT